MTELKELLDLREEDIKEITDEEVEKYKIRGLNFNYIGVNSNRAIKNYAICDIETGEIINKTYLISI